MDQPGAYQPPTEYSSEDLINASELREFVFCERAWWLSRQGYAVSLRGQSDRAAGLTFHKERARAARSANTGTALWWAIISALAALAIWLIQELLEKQY